MLRHRDAWAIEERAPTKERWEHELAANPPSVTEPPISAKPSAVPPVRRTVESPAPATSAAVTLSHVDDDEILIVVSKMKKYIKDRSGMNCGDAVAAALSDHVRAACDEAIRAAARDERKTVLERDVARPPKRELR